MAASASESERAFRDRFLAARRSVQARLAAIPLAYSTDGKTFGYQAPITASLPAGGYVSIVTEEGREYLGQVITKDVIAREGPEIKLSGGAGLTDDLEGIDATETAFRIRLQAAEGQGVLLARLNGEGLTPTTLHDLFKDADISLADGDAIDRYLRDRAAGRASLDIGPALFGNGQARALLDASGFNRHTFLCGQSGSGKTFSLGVILERLLAETDLRILIIDPNSDFVRLHNMRMARGHANDEGFRNRYEAAAAGIRVLRPAPSNGSESLRIRFSDLSTGEQGLVLKLDPLGDRDEFNTLARSVESLGREDYDLSEVLSATTRNFSQNAREIGLRIENLGVADWDVWSKEGDRSIVEVLEDNWRALVLDVGGFGTPAEKSIVAMAVLGHLWDNREARRPLLVVIDEAHNICPTEPTDPLQAAATEHAIRIAGEGRKFGIYFLLSTQRPQKIHPNVLSQCDNLVLLRMNSADDLDHIGAIFSFVPRSLVSQASQFSQGEALLAGKIVAAPTFGKFEGRISEEGGSDVPTEWARHR
jgi:DNA helicase HerA-like ATPase